MKGVKILFGAIAILYLLGTSYQMYMFLNFQTHKEEIIKKHCVNKEKPEMHCDGNCHLKKKLVQSPVQVFNMENQSEESPNFKVVSFDTFNEVFYAKVKFTHNIDNKCCAYYSKPYSFFNVEKDIHPPEEV
jgi:hypothetical protein